MISKLKPCSLNLQMQLQPKFCQKKNLHVTIKYYIIYTRNSLASNNKLGTYNHTQIQAKHKTETTSNLGQSHYYQG